MKSILITGATGFVASHLIPHLVRCNHKITVTTRKAQHSNSFLSNLKVVENHEIDGNTDWQEALKKIDIVIHLAARAHIPLDNSPNSKQEFRKVNVQGTANLVQQSIAAGVKQFILISSIGAMATLSQQILTENSPCNPDTPYGTSKLQAEQSLIDLASNSDMTWTILRPTLVYGPGNPGNMARLIKLIKLGLPLPFGTVKNSRSLLYVGNLVDAITTCLSHPRTRNKTFIVSDSENLSTPELIREISYHLKRSCYLLPVHTKFLRTSGRLGDRLESLFRKPLIINSSTIDRLIGSLAVDSRNIRNTLNWRPPYTMTQGLAETLRWVAK